MEHLEKAYIEFLGTGTSQGTPVISCNCEVCTSADSKNHRLRTAALVHYNSAQIVIDAGPDFRQQMLRANVKQLDAILLTHEHKDHLAGLDDIRPFNYLQKKAIDIYAEQRVIEAIEREYAYAFGKESYPGIPIMNIIRMPHEEFIHKRVAIQPIRVMHWNLPIVGFKINNLAYITDASHIADEELEKIKQVDVLVINALRKEKHYSHFNLHEALEIIKIIQPAQAFITHISHAMGLHSEVQKTLPPHVHLAYDRLKVYL